MCCRIILSIILIFSSILYSRGTTKDAESDFISALLALTGCGSEEEIDEYEAERYYELYEMPLRLNYASRSKLLSSGLFSAYQVAVIMDYREMAGDILSLEELSALDGFGKSFVACLKYFISLASDALPGYSSSSGSSVRNSLTLKSGIRNVSAELSPEGTYSVKYRLSAGEIFETGISFRSSYGDSHFPPETYSFFAACYGKKFPGKVIIGDYNLRFGQGLALWPGFSMGGTASPNAFARRPSGISPYNSYSGEGAFRGIAADFTKRHFSFSAFVSGLGLRELMEGADDFSSDILYGANIGWYGLNGQVSLTGYAVSEIPELDGTNTVPQNEQLSGPVFEAAKFSADAKFSVRGTVLFAETALDLTNKSIAATGGCRTRLSDALDMAVMARYYPPDYSAEYSGAARSGTKCSNEYGVSAALSHSFGKWMEINGKTGFGASEKRFYGDVSIDAAYSPEPKYGVDTSSIQIKLSAKENIRLFPFLSLTFRLSERYRSYGQPFRTDVRTDFKFSWPMWSCNLRLNLLHCENLSGLSYFETGYRSDRLSLWLRTGIFIVDDWDDRIYAYERDAPGNFNSPAYYGRGYWLALTSGWKIARGFKLYFRGLFQDYPWLRPSEAERKPPKAEFKVQFVMDLYHFSKTK